MALNRIVFGYHPAWAGNAYRRYQWDLLSHAAFFSAEADPATGGIKTSHGWSTSAMVTAAKAAGVKVILTCTNIGDAPNTALLSDAGRRGRLIDELVTLAAMQQADGINIDFEGLNASQRGNLVQFANDLAAGAREARPGAEISFATPAIDWRQAYDMASLAAVSDYLVMMGYDYSYRGSKNAGPVAPLAGRASLTQSVAKYLASGVPPGKLVLALPYYGYDWPVADNTRGSAATGPGKAVLYTAAQAQATAQGRQFDAASASPFYSYRDAGGAWHQVWYEDAESLARKYALVHAQNLAGAGIWALSYDGERPELWDALRTAFTTKEEGAVAP